MQTGRKIQKDRRWTGNKENRKQVEINKVDRQKNKKWTERKKIWKVDNIQRARFKEDMQIAT